MNIAEIDPIFLALYSFTLTGIIHIAATIFFSAYDTCEDSVVIAKNWKKRAIAWFLLEIVFGYFLFFTDNAVALLKSLSDDELPNIENICALGLGASGYFLLVEIIWCGLLKRNYWIGSQI